MSNLFARSLPPFARAALFLATLLPGTVCGYGQPPGLSFTDDSHRIPEMSWIAHAIKQATVMTTVQESAPLEHGQRYFRVAVRCPAAAAPPIAGAVQQKYGDIPEHFRTLPHTIRFLYRFDSDLSTLESIRLFDTHLQTVGPYTKEPGTTWLITTSPSSRQWIVQDGTKTISTGIILQTGLIYRFTIHVFPAKAPEASSYNVTIEELAGPASYTSPRLRFFSPQSATEGYLTFSLRGKSGQKPVFSISPVELHRTDAPLFTPSSKSTLPISRSNFP